MNDLEARLSALETKLAIMEDKENIRDLITRYGPLADTADTSERRQLAGQLFASEGVYDLGADWQAEGPNAVGELLNNPDHLQIVANGSAHVMSNPTIKLEGNTAKALCYSRVYRHEAGNFTLWRVAANYWECEKQEGTWRVTRRVNRLLNGSDEARELLRRIDEL